MSERPYRKAMVTNLFFRKIKALVLEVDSSFTSVDIVSTIAIYFNFNTSFADNGASVVAKTIRAAVFRVSNLTGLWIRSQCGTDVYFGITNARPTDIYYFTLRSNSQASDIDIRGPVIFFVDFVLKLPQNTVVASTQFLSNITSLT